MKLGIHKQPHGWRTRWIEYCAQRGIGHAEIDGYSSDVIEQIRGLDGLLWHIHNNAWREVFMAQDVLEAAERMGVHVFPDRATRWHFDNKLAQKYLLEAAGLPLIPTHVFFDLSEALAWLDSARYPLVAKLRRGGGSTNVRLLRDRRAAQKYCRRMFGRGFQPIPGYTTDARHKARRMLAVGDWRKVLARVRLFQRVSGLGRRSFPRERGYVLLQEFMPDNQYDIRIAVIGNRAWGFTRESRPGDFRASGSGMINYDRSRLSDEYARLGFHVAEALDTQSLGIDLLRGRDGEPRISEISFGFVSQCVHDCPGYWDSDLNWHPEHIWPEHAIIDDLCERIRNSGARPS